MLYSSSKPVGVGSFKLRFVAGFMFFLSLHFVYKKICDFFAFLIHIFGNVFSNGLKWISIQLFEHRWKSSIKSFEPEFVGFRSNFFFSFFPIYFIGWPTAARAQLFLPIDIWSHLMSNKETNILYIEKRKKTEHVFELSVWVFDWKHRDISCIISDILRKLKR